MGETRGVGDVEGRRGAHGRGTYGGRGGLSKKIEN